MTDNTAPAPVAPQVTAADRKRIKEIVAFGTANKMPQAMIDTHIDKGSSLEAFKAAMIDEKIKADVDFGQPQINANTDATDFSRVTSRGMTDFEAPNFVAQEKTNHVLALLKGQRPTGKFEGLTHPSAMFDSGKKWLPRAASAGGMHTSGDFSVATEQAANLLLQELMKAADNGISLVAAVSTFKDFRTNADIGMGSFPELSELPEGADIQHGTIGETKETWKGASYARMIKVSFQTQTNDMFGAISRSIRDVSIATVQLKSGLLVSALSKVMADGNALYHASHGNLAGAGAAMSVVTLGSARAAMRTQKVTGSAAPLGIGPKFLLTPAAYETDAEKLVTDIQAGTVADANPFSGKLTVAAEPRLTGTAWHLFADPTLWPVLKFATLEGYELPRIEFEDMFTSLGSAFRVHWHVAATAVDYRGTYKNPGA